MYLHQSHGRESIDFEWEDIRDIMLELGLPTNAKEIGVGEDILIEALGMAKNVRDRYTILSEYNLTRDRCREILEKLEII